MVCLAGWQKVYDNDPLQISRNLTQGVLQENLIQGGEAAMWTEQVDDHNLASKVRYHVFSWEKF